MIFSEVAFRKFCKKSRSSHQGCSIKKAVLKHLRTTATVNSRAAVFQESLALPFKQNILTSGICDFGELV